MFFDSARIYIRSGDGGDGHISFRREKFVSMGGPDGGSGGHGGDITFVVDKNMNSLARYRRNIHYRAGNGKHGGRKKMSGARGESLRLFVPPGTVIREADGGPVLADLTEAEQEALILAGGRGGRGNAVFANSVHQAPEIAYRGEEGEELWLELELKLIADVGLAGVPNAGKSTLLAAVSGARPKIAAYPFTTLQPSLGVVELDDYTTMVLADIPGLIEGAAQGVGLGHDFLRHLERTRVLIHLLDGGARDPLEDWAMINQELALYRDALVDKPQLVVLNKMDLPDAVAWEPLIAERMAAEGYAFMSISAATGLNVRPMLYRVKQMLDEAPQPLVEIYETVSLQPDRDDESFSLEQVADGWRVHGVAIERIARKTYWEFDATVERFQRILEKMGITEALHKAGVEPGDTVHIGDSVLEWSDA